MSVHAILLPCSELQDQLCSRVFQLRAHTLESPLSLASHVILSKLNQFPYMENRISNNIWFIGIL